jgi:capsule polysaccharide export protein KpsE/RkpR
MSQLSNKKVWNRKKEKNRIKTLSQSFVINMLITKLIAIIIFFKFFSSNRNN